MSDFKPRLHKDLFVVKLSGSLFFSDRFDPFVKSVQRMLKNKKSLRLVLVAGGGEGARRYIEAARRVGADQSSLDEIGIAVSRLNAHVLMLALKDSAVQKVPCSLNEVVEAVELSRGQRNKVVVVGGLHPGQSTNAVGALIAEKLRAERFYNSTDVDGVYSEDPRKSNKAKKLYSVSTTELARILGSESMKAGGYDLMDPIALKLIERSRIPSTVLKCDPEILERAVMKRKGKVGTEIIVDS